MSSKEIIIVTDGDSIAKTAVETATKNVGGRCISTSAGNPTMISGDEIIDLVEKAKNNPVVVMVDDCGDKGSGKGEEALETLLATDKFKLLGVVAVASNDADEDGVDVDFSVDKDGKKVNSAVNKFGKSVENNKIFGDTISVLNKYRNKIPVVIGIGDPGKMDHKDDYAIGSPITTLALQEVISFNK